MRLGIISDIHCHELKKDTPRGGYYYPMMPEVPINQNPFSSLKRFIRQNNLEVDYLLSPGDYSHQIDPIGLKSAWDQLKLISNEFNSKALIGTIGNHDVLSRDATKGPFELIKKFDLDFPFYKSKDSKQYKNDLISNTYFTYNDGGCLFIVLNSSFDHWTAEESRKGKIDKDAIFEIQNLIKEDKSKYKILLVHHHPIVHETGILDTEDLIKGSEEIMSKLNDIDLIIHGHKHDFRFTQHLVYPKNLNILGAGSFSCFITAKKPMVLNSFHIIDFDIKELEDCINQGYINTYTFDPDNGWKEETQFKEGFGCNLQLNDVVVIIESIVIQNTLPYTTWNEIIEIDERLKYITRNTRNKALIEIESKGSIVRVSFDSYSKFPNEIIIR